MDLTNIKDLLPLFVLFGGMGSESDTSPESPADIFPMIFMMRFMDNPDGNYRTTIEEQIQLALQIEMLTRQQGMASFAPILTLAKLFV